MRRRGSTGPKAFFAALGVTVIGVVWLVGGLAWINTFFFYPIFLIFVGVIGMVANVGGLFKRQPQLPQQRVPYAAPPQPPMYYAQPSIPQTAPFAAVCWQCGRPNEGRPVCATCGAQQYAPPPQPPMGAYGTMPGYPPAPNYPQQPGYSPAPGYPPAQPPQQPPQNWR